MGDLLDVHDLHFAGTAPSGRHEDFHGIHLIFAATVAADAEPRVVEVDGTTDAVAWVSRSTSPPARSRCSTWSAWPALTEGVRRGGAGGVGIPASAGNPELPGGCNPP